MLVEDNLLAIPLSWYSGWPDPNYGENVLELGPNYCIEAMNGLTYLAGANPDASTVAILTVPGAYGQDGAAGAKIAAAALGLEVVYAEGEGAVGSGADQSEVITELLNASPDLVWAAITPTSLRQILGSAYAGGLRARWSGNSPTYDYHLLDTDIATILDDFYTHSTYHELWNTGDAPGMQALVDAMRAKRPDAPASDVYVVAWEAGLVTKQVLEKAAVNGDMTRAGVVAAAKDPTLEIDLQGLSPNQTYGGDPNDFIVRQTYVFDVDLTKYTSGATVSDPDAGTGYTALLDGPFVSDTARDYDYQGPCFVPED
jgi:ABC-type branched-subunit amino acid transport system substrate-binding protein